MGCFIEKQVGPDGAIFGSVTPSELSNLIESRAGIFVDKKIISIPDINKEKDMTIPAQKPGQSPTKVAGSAIVDVKFHPEVTCKFKILIVPKA